MRHLTTEEKVDAIYRLLKGDQELDPQDEGLVGSVRNIKKRLFDLENWKNKTVAWALGVSFGGGALIAFVITVVFKK